MIQLPALSSIPHLKHGFLTRRGGVSTGPFSSLNSSTSKGDSVENILQNHHIALQRIGVEEHDLVAVRQVHGTDVVSVAEKWPYEERPSADAMVTNVPGIALGVSGADCAPVLFADSVVPVIGAAHAGWKGAKAGVAEAVVLEMRKMGAENIVAAIGPCIAQESYEVSADFREDFIQEESENCSFFLHRQERYLFDLKGFIRHRLLLSGVMDVDISSYDTYAEEELFFSYRRTCHHGGTKYGCNLSLITLLTEF